MTLGGLVKHVALVKADWPAVKLAGQEWSQPTHAWTSPTPSQTASTRRLGANRTAVLPKRPANGIRIHLRINPLNEL
jgi:hypothetical protein